MSAWRPGEYREGRFGCCDVGRLLTGDVLHCLSAAWALSRWSCTGTTPPERVRTSQSWPGEDIIMEPSFIASSKTSWFKEETPQGLVWCSSQLALIQRNFSSLQLQSLLTPFVLTAFWSFSEFWESCDCYDWLPQWSQSSQLQVASETYQSLLFNMQGVCSRHARR